jgi:hypothetical protein
MHIASDVMLAPLAPFDTENARKSYPAMYTGDMVAKELSHIKLMEDEE